MPLIEKQYRGDRPLKKAMPQKSGGLSLAVMSPHHLPGCASPAIAVALALREPEYTFRGGGPYCLDSLMGGISSEFIVKFFIVKGVPYF
jgi:hypothetical protein